MSGSSICASLLSRREAILIRIRATPRSIERPPPRPLLTCRPFGIGPFHLGQCDLLDEQVAGAAGKEKTPPTGWTRLHRRQPVDRPVSPRDADESRRIDSPVGEPPNARNTATRPERAYLAPALRRD
jgi:hypothetical protein